jgi:hypothetical protein
MSEILQKSMLGKQLKMLEGVGEVGEMDLNSRKGGKMLHNFCFFMMVGI